VAELLRANRQNIMIELITPTPSNVIGFKASGEITSDDYKKVIFPQVKKQVSAVSELNYVFVIDTNLKNFSGGAWVQDVWLGLKEMAHWHRVAIVSDEERIRKFTDTAGTFVPGEYKGFPLSELNQAINWAASE
jgi:hypothetical protein